MATIMSFGNSDRTRRCDARCHDATQSKCDCICGGAYHGCTRGSGREPQTLVDAELMRQGLDPEGVALEAKRRISEDLVKALGAKDGLSFMTEFAARCEKAKDMQLALFGELVQKGGADEHYKRTR